MPTVALIRAVVRLTEPGGVSVPAPPRRDDINLAVDRGPDGRPHLPGTTLAGGLRAMVASYGGCELADRLFGRLVERDPGRDSVDAVASPIWALGARLLPEGEGEGGVDTTVRQITAIDRHRGAARNRTLHTEEVLPEGTCFEAFLRWDDPARDELETFLAHLGGWRPLIGHAVSRGRGGAAVDAVSFRVLDLGRPDHLAMWLRGHGPDLFRKVAVEPPPDPRRGAEDPVRVAVPVRINGPLRVGSGVAESDDRAGPKVARLFRIGDRVVLPGSGLKGLLRSRCEYILRSLDARPKPCPDQQCGRCWPCQVFGHGGGESRDAEGVGSRARVRILDAEVTGLTQVERTHVAIDRFTGGARDEQLYTVEALEAGTFTLTIELLPDLADRHDRQLRALLRLIMADLTDGLLGVGAAVARGYGSVTPELTDADLPILDDARATLRDLLTEGARS